MRETRIFVIIKHRFFVIIDILLWIEYNIKNTFKNKIKNFYFCKLIYIICKPLGL